LVAIYLVAFPDANIRSAAKPIALKKHPALAANHRQTPNGMIFNCRLTTATTGGTSRQCIRKCFSMQFRSAKGPFHLTFPEMVIPAISRHVKRLWPNRGLKAKKRHYPRDISRTSPT
jgi:hypothetical protein